MSRPRTFRLLWTLVLLLAAPAVLVGPVLEGRALLWHAHGGEGGHVHLLAEHEHGPAAEARHERLLSAEHDGHAHAHGHDHAHPEAPAEHREADCFAVPFTEALNVPVTVRGVASQRALLASARNDEPWPAPHAAVRPARTRAPAARGPGTKLRKGVAAVVASGRAVRI